MLDVVKALVETHDVNESGMTLKEYVNQEGKIVMVMKLHL